MRRMPPMTVTCLVVLFDIAAPSRLWGWSRFVLGVRALAGVGGLRFAKLLGSGHEAGFGLRPSGSRQGLFCQFEDEAAADRFLADSPQMAAYRRHAREIFHVKLRPFSCRGSWSGVPVPVAVERPTEGMVAALTRASIRPSKALRFWRHAPPSEVALAGAPGCRLAAGLGEAPVLRQATFSLWDSVADMDAYARSGAHLAAIQASRVGDFFTESMFVRFVPVQATGVWKGQQFG